jgi:ABC-type transporter Mla subunit MlaD
MPAQRTDEFKLGVTVIVIIALFFGTVIFIGGAAIWGPKTRTVRVYFRHDMSLPTLKNGGDVRCGGQRVGSIESVEMRELPADQVTGKSKKAADDDKGLRLAIVVTAEIDRAVGLREDCQITAEGPTLGGSGWLIIRNRGTAKPLGPDTPVIGLRPGGLAAVTETLTQLGDTLSQELDAQNAESLLGKIHRSLSDVNVMTSAVKEQLDASDQKALLAKLHRSVGDINAITGELRHQMDPKADRVALGKMHAALDAVNAGLDEAVAMLKENREPVRDTVAHVRSTARTLDSRIAAAIADQLDVHRHASLLAKVHEDVDRIGESLKDVNAITADVRELLAVNKPAVERTLVNFKETSGHLKAAAKDLRRNPWRLLYQPSDKETREMNVFDAARAFADAATRLDDASVRLEALIAEYPTTRPADAAELRALQDELQATFEKFSQAEAALWNMLKLH